MPFSALDVVSALYNAVLGREPDPIGLQAYTDILAADPLMLPSVAKSMFDSAEHKEILGRLGLADHSQYGEFPLCLKHFVARGRRHGLIVDVGARGMDRSNSFDFASVFGWKALLIEANPMLWNSIEREFSGTHFILEKCAVSTTEGELPFYVGINEDVSSLIRQAAANWGEIRQEIKVKTRRLDRILREHDVPLDFDILSIDIEGLDVVVLNDLIETTDYRPEMVIIETSMNFAWKYPDDTGVSGAVRSNYSLAHQTVANMLLVRGNAR